MNSTELVHRLLFQALLEMRADGHDTGNKLVFHLSDLFHNAVLQMEAVAQGKQECSYDQVLAFLKKRAAEKGLSDWLTRNLREIEAQHVADSTGRESIKSATP